MEQKNCPRCKCKPDVAFRAMVVSTWEWPLALMIGGLFLIAGDIIGLKVSETFLFVAGAILPIFFRIESRCGCGNCGIQFETKN